MRLKEALVWGTILVTLFAGGYLHGSLPFAKIKRLLNPDKQLRLIIHTPVYFPESLVKSLEKKSYTLRIDPVQHFDDLKVELLKTPGPDLILIPEKWVSSLEKENLLAKNPDLLFEQFAVDFSNHNHSFYPWFWFITKAFKTENSTNDVLSTRNDLWLETLINDAEGLLKHENKKVLLPHLMKISGTSSELVKGISELWILGWAIPRTAESFEDSQNLLADLYDYPIYETTLVDVPGASVLKRTDEEPWEHWKKAKALRDFSFTELQ